MYTRRSFLNTMAGSSVALAPFLANMKLEASGDASKLPKRFVFVIKGNGLRPYGVVPKGLEEHGAQRFKTEKFVDESLSEHELNDSMKSLEPFKDRMSIIQGLSSKVCKGPHGGHFGVLGAYTSGDHAPPRRETLDAVFARELPGIFPYLAFHIGMSPEDLFKYLDISAQGKNTRTPAFASASLAYKEIFGTVMSGDSAKVEAAANANLMDFLVNDVKRVQKSLSSAEKEKLDHYLHGFEALRDRKVKLTGMGPKLGEHAPEMDDKYTSEIETHRLEAHFDMATAALITGLTNVVTVRADELGVRYQGFDHDRMKTISVHEIGHTADVEGMNDRYTNNWKEGREMRRRIRTYQMELLAGMASKLDAVPEGDGSMLDNTVIVYLSDAGSTHHTGYDNMPTVVLGNMNGAFKTGRYLHYPDYNQPGHRTLANLHRSLLHAAGLPFADFGDNDLGLNESINQAGLLEEFMA